MELYRHSHRRELGLQVPRRPGCFLSSPKSLTSGNSFTDTPFSPPGEVASFVPRDLLRGVEVCEEEEETRDVAGHCYAVLSTAAAAAAFRKKPLQAAIVGNTAAGKTMVVRWLWAQSHGCGNAGMLREIERWFRRGGGSTVTEEVEDDIVSVVLQSQLQLPLRSPSSNDRTIGSIDGTQRVKLTAYGETHVFLSDDARFLVQPSTAVSEAVMHVVDCGVSVAVRVVDIPGCSSRELLRTQCMEADVVICTVDTRDQFSLTWLEERLYVILAGSRADEHTQTADSVAAQCTHQHRRQQFVLLKLNEGSPQQVVYSRDVQ
ncbi:hypothetical protein DQ04_02171040 [Trypanosoma grayi]|uniref:hypothetical protein n=1 Tax=Trypanosoma grayi TaxID=71804 RepID=UPI0004F44C5B|nr:hypothetical protein DQ04_02171040 [Trypanosoma grayi]KEG11897.1 hypothetical protein DQ04_02171040 [Trypanosoma grayi]